jgi:subtilase family serine protease
MCSPSASGIRARLAGEVVHDFCRSPDQSLAGGSSGDEPHLSIHFAFGEEVLDAEVVHAIAPRAALTIVLVKGTSLDSADQAVAASVAALRLGASQGGIISLSPAGQIGGEHCVDDTQLTQLNAALQADAGPHVTVVAATGDTGAAGNRAPSSTPSAAA